MAETMGRVEGNGQHGVEARYDSGTSKIEKRIRTNMQTTPLPRRRSWPIFHAPALPSTSCFPLTRMNCTHISPAEEKSNESGVIQSNEIKVVQSNATQVVMSDASQVVNEAPR
eukprot:6197695-Pleurochrysis_carterae.AAC.2